MLLGCDDRAAGTNIGLRLGIGRGGLLEPLPRAGIGLRQRLLALLLFPRRTSDASAESRAASACAIVAYCSST